MTSLSAKDKFLGEERRVGFKPTALWFKTQQVLFLQKSYIYHAVLYRISLLFCILLRFFCSLISSLLVFELFSPIVILKTEHFDDKNDMEPQHRHIKLIRQKEAGRLYNHEIVSVH